MMDEKEYASVLAAPAWVDLGLAFSWIEKKMLFGLRRATPPSSKEISRFVEGAGRFPIYGRAGLGTPATDPRLGYAFAGYGDPEPVPFEVIAAAYGDGVLGCDIDRSRLFRARATGDCWGGGRPNDHPQSWEYIEIRVASIDVVLAFASESTAHEVFRVPLPVSQAIATAIGSERIVLELLYRLGLQAKDLCELRHDDLQPPKTGGDDDLPVFTYRLTVRSPNWRRAITLPKSWNEDLAAASAGRSPDRGIFDGYTPSRILAAFNRAAKRSNLDAISRHWALTKPGFRARSFGRSDSRGSALPSSSVGVNTRVLRILDQIREEMNGMAELERQARWTPSAIKARAQEVDTSLSGKERQAIATILGRQMKQLWPVLDKIREEMNDMAMLEREARWRREAIKARARDLGTSLSINAGEWMATALLSDKARGK